jgi:hypothetical protein
MRRNTDPDVRDKNLRLVNLDALSPEARAEVERDIDRYEEAKAERKRQRQMFKEIRAIRNGTPGRPWPDGSKVAPDGAVKMGHESAVVRAKKDSPRRKDGKGTVVSEPGARSRPMGYSHAGVKTVGIDSDGHEVGQS